MTREATIAAIRQCAESLGRNPTRLEIFEKTDIRKYDVMKHFGSFGPALRAAGLDPKGIGHRVDARALLLDWATVARKEGKLPSASHYQREGAYSVKPFVDRFGGWMRISQAFRQLLQETGTEDDWMDVLEMIAERQQMPMPLAKPKRLFEEPPARPRMIPGRPVFGQPLARTSLANAPINEMGVVYLFGLLSEELGYVVTHIQSDYPDCEAYREFEPGSWQRVWIEFEYQSRNFVAHGHDPEKCDVIVCWHNNWPECRLEVIELRKAIGAVVKRLARKGTEEQGGKSVDRVSG